MSAEEIPIQIVMTKNGMKIYSDGKEVVPDEAIEFLQTSDGTFKVVVDETKSTPSQGSSLVNAVETLNVLLKKNEK